MKKQTVTKIILSVIIFALFVSISPVFSTTEAAVSNTVISDLFSNPNQSGEIYNKYKFTTAQVLKSGILQNVIGCTGVVNKVATWMARFQSSPFKMKQKAEAEAKKRVEQIKAACKATKAAITQGLGLVPTASDTTTSTQTAFEKFCAESVDAKNDAQIALALDAQEAQTAQTVKEQCFDGIAITLAKNQLTAMTRSATNWVNSGYGGNPLFVQNMTNFTNNIERNVLETGIDALLAPDGNQNPYASDFARSSIRGYGSSSHNFLGNLQSDLGAFINDPVSYYSDNSINRAERTALQRAQDANSAFANDFSVGGWDGWLALTQRDQNNPLGFTMLASQQLADTQAAQINLKKDELTQNNGFLSQKTCVKWQVYTEDGKPKISDEYTKWRSSLRSNFEKGTRMPEMFEYSTSKPSVCYKAGGECCAPEDKGGWKIVTPGSIIRDKTTNYLNSPERQLEFAKTINDSLNALFSVLISKLEGGGLSGLSESVANNSNWNDSSNRISTDDGSGSTPYNNNGAYNGFNLTRDLGNTYIYDDVYKAGTWDARSGINLTDQGDQMSLGYVPPVYKNNTIKEENLITSNIYWDVKNPGNINLVENGYNGWEVGDRAFWDGSGWQNWKCQANKDGKCTNQLNPVKTRGVIQIQKDYIVAAKEIMKVLPSVMTKLGELDYCIPGPNPSYKSNSSNAQSAYLDWVGTLYVGPMGGDGNRTQLSIDRPGDRTYDNLQNIYKDNPNVWRKILGNTGTEEGMQFLLTWFNSYRFGKNGGYSGGSVAFIESHNNVMNMTLNYVNNSLFQNFYELFDKMMDKMYFKNMVNKYIETENTPDLITNKGYIQMAESGLNLTKDISYYNDDISKTLQDYRDSINQAQLNISKLEPIKVEVSKIIKAAQDRRDAALLEKIKKDKCDTQYKQCMSMTAENSGQVSFKIIPVASAAISTPCDENYKICMETKVSDADKKAFNVKYAGCLEEENIQFFDIEDITGPNTSRGEERCSNGIDDDLDGLVDAKDPDCLPNGGNPIIIAAHCETNTAYATSKNTHGKSINSCSDQDMTAKNQGVSEAVRKTSCENYSYYRDNNGIDESTDPYVIYSCDWIPRG
jgi:hypothetical protein